MKPRENCDHDGAYAHRLNAISAAPDAALDLFIGKRFRITLRTLLPGAEISTHFHMHRSEHWMVVQGTGIAVAGTQAIHLTEESHLTIPRVMPHSLSNPGRISLIFVEIQSGDCVDADLELLAEAH